MAPPASFSPANKTEGVDPAQKIKHLPATAQAAFRRYQVENDPAALDPLIFAILENYNPRKLGRPLAEHPGSALLMDELGFDSLAITEVIFFMEDLFEINIANEEIIKVRTLDDLRGFIRRKVAARTAV